MLSAIRKFIWAALGLATFLLIVSVVFLLRSSADSDPDSMMLALLLLAFSVIASLVFIIILWKMKEKEP